MIDFFFISSQWTVKGYCCPEVEIFFDFFGTHTACNSGVGHYIHRPEFTWQWFGPLPFIPSTFKFSVICRETDPIRRAVTRIIRDKSDPYSSIDNNDINHLQRIIYGAQRGEYDNNNIRFGFVITGSAAITTTFGSRTPPPVVWRTPTGLAMTRVIRHSDRAERYRNSTYN